MLLCLTTIAFSQQKNATEKTTIKGELTFGKNPDCIRRGGICTFNTSQNKALANTQITYNKDNTITLIIDRTKITIEEEYKIVGQYCQHCFINTHFLLVRRKILCKSNPQITHNKCWVCNGSVC